MDKTLLQWARENKVTYGTAYNWYRSNKLPVEAFKNDGNIYVREAPVAPLVPTKAITKTELGVPKSTDLFSNDGLSVAGTSTRMNRSAIIDPLARFANIQNAFTPFNSGSGAINTSDISIRDAVILCVKAYYSFSPVRLIIDTITEFSASPIYFTGNNKQAVKFFESWARVIGLADFTEQFFLEFNRSGNDFVYRQDSTWKSEDIANLNKVLGAAVAAGDVVLPARYIILNPAEVQITGTGSFVNPSYEKILTDYEIERLKHPVTDQDRLLLESLPEEQRKQIQGKGDTTCLSYPLDPDKLVAVFNKKMTYEPFATPPLFPLLDDLEFKSELKRLDRAVMRTIQSAVLHIKVGYESKEGEHIYSQKVADALEAIFQNETVARVLVTDFSVELAYVIPEISDILDPKKYEIVNGDIKEGLNNIVFGSGTEEKFSNTQTKVRVFIEKIRRARETFLNNFLIPEVKRISKLMGFKSYPIPHFEDIDIENEVEYSRMVTRLAELGLLTPQEAFQAIETGRLPTPEESLESQQTFKENRDKGLYQPLVGGPADQKELAEMGFDAKLEQIKSTPGRPPGSKSPKKPAAVGGIQSFKALTEALVGYGKLSDTLAHIVKTDYKLTELDDNQNQLLNEAAELVMANEPIANWENEQLLREYLENPEAKRNPSRLQQLEEIKAQFNCANFLGCILLNSSNATQ
jgi:hypothetical protein